MCAAVALSLLVAGAGCCCRHRHRCCLCGSAIAKALKDSQWTFRLAGERATESGIERMRARERERATAATFYWYQNTLHTAMKLCWNSLPKFTFFRFSVAWYAQQFKYVYAARLSYARIHNFHVYVWILAYFEANPNGLWFVVVLKRRMNNNKLETNKKKKKKQKMCNHVARLMTIYTKAFSRVYAHQCSLRVLKNARKLR